MSPCELSTAVLMVIFFFRCRHFREIKEEMKWTPLFKTVCFMHAIFYRASSLRQAASSRGNSICNFYLQFTFAVLLVGGFSFPLKHLQMTYRKAQTLLASGFWCVWPSLGDLTLGSNGMFVCDTHTWMNISLMLMSIPHSYYNLICNVVVITEWDVW